MTTTTDTVSTELTSYDPNAGTQGVVVGQHVQQFVEFAKTLAVSDLLPDGLRGKPGNVFMAIMQGLDLGLRPMQALQLIDVIKGKPCLKAEGMRALILDAGHEINVVEQTDEKCIIEGRRKGSDDWRTASFTIDQAKAAGLAGDNWKKYPADMLLARATSRLAKAYFADVTNGLASSEELLDTAPPAPTRTLAEVAKDRDKPAADEVVDAVVVDEPTDEEIHAAVLAAAGDACPSCGTIPACGPTGCPVADTLDVDVTGDDGS